MNIKHRNHPENHTLLIVENEPNYADELVRLCKVEGYRVLLADRGKDAVRIAQRCRPDAIVAQAIMPEMSGLALVRELRKDPLTTGIPIILISHADDVETQRRAMLVGADDYLTREAVPLYLPETIAARLARVEQVHERCRQKLQHHQEFLAMVSHDLRAPLTVIGLSLETLRFDLPSEQLPTMQRMQKAVAMSRLMLDRLIALGRSEQGHLPFRPQKTDFNALCLGAIDTARALHSDDREIRASIEVPLPVELDPVLMGEVLINLLSNALKYTPNLRAVDLVACVEDSTLVIAVQDYGEGIEEHHLPKIFTSYYRCAEHAHLPGLGLGLSAVKRFVEMHRGTIECRSSRGHGTTFIIRVPISANDAPDHGDGGNRFPLDLPQACRVQGAKSSPVVQ